MHERGEDRRYTEREVRAILQRAVELHAAFVSGEEACGAEATGATLAQLQLAAGEIGIEPRLIEQAAAELDAEPRAGYVARLVGGPWFVESDRLVSGTIGEEGWPLLLDDMRAATGRVGYPKAVGRGFEWLSLQPDPIHVTLTPHGGQTRVRVTARFGQWAGVFCVAPFVLAAVVATGIVLSLGGTGALTPAAVALILAGLPLLTLAAGRAGFSRFCGRRRRQMRALVAAVEGRITRPQRPASMPTDRRVTSAADEPVTNINYVG